MHREQRATTFHAALITLGFKFGYTHAHERANEPANSAACAQACKSGDNRSRREKGADARYSQRTRAGKKTQRTANDAAQRCSSGCPFRSLGVLLMRKLPGAARVGQEHGYRTTREICSDQQVYSPFSFDLRCKDAENRSVLAIHDGSPMKFLKCDGWCATSALEFAQR